MASARPRGGFLGHMAAESSTRPPLSNSSAAAAPAPATTMNQEYSIPNRNGTNENQHRSNLSNVPRGQNRRSANRYNYQSDNPRPETNYEPPSTTTTSRTPANRQNAGIRINFNLLKSLVEKTPDEILSDLLNPKLSLPTLLNDNQMRDRFDWVFLMTRILERVTTCEGARERISMVLTQLPETKYVDGIHAMVRSRDSITDELRYDLLQSFLKMFNRFLALVPQSSESLLKVSERIELLLKKTESNSLIHRDTRAILDEVLERVEEIEERAKRIRDQNQAASNGNTTNPTDPLTIDLPPDNFRELSIIPDVQEILSEQKPFLRANIVNGAYENPNHYLDVHFRLLREDFVGPLREGIQQYKSGSNARNFNVRIYENVHLCGSRLSPKSGIVFDLLLDRNTASNIAWTNSRRLLYGNLLLLTYNDFQSCIFVTVEDRSNVEKTLCISVQPLDKVNNAHGLQFSLDDIDYSHSLTMIETMTYFEAYRPVLNALQMIPSDDSFPLEPYLLRLSNAPDPPNYINRNTTYDFTPLLVDPNSEVKAGVTSAEANPRRNFDGREASAPLTKEFQIKYRQANTVPAKYKKVELLNKETWPTSEELHLNPKQREALMLALTHKVGLIQGPPGTGKTFLGVRIAEMLLHNRSVWCPQSEQSTPILMICNTNHALDQFLELIINRLKLNEGVIRVGNRCQNPAIQRFALTHTRRYARDNRSIPREIYHQKHTIVDRKAQAEETLKYYNESYQQSFDWILPLFVLMQSKAISDDHIASLTAYNQNVPDDSVLFDWLGVGHNHKGYQDEILSLLNAEKSETEQTPTDDQETKSTNDNNVAAENNETDEKDETDQQNLNEEEEEELRRRNELDFDDDFLPSLVHRPEQQTTDEFSLQTNEYANDEGGWQTVVKSRAKVLRLVRYIIDHPTKLTDDLADDIQGDLWSLSLAQRCDLYRYWLQKYRVSCHYATRQARQEYNQAIAALAEYYQEEDYYLLKDSAIVAMTTTGAARYHTVLEKLQSKIVIVEEGAAIFEAHIITALSTGCQHLILIGDHVQLRPNPSVYTLAVKYRLEVSLFERLVNNQFPNVRLNIQHRMRPEIARLMKHFYNDLEDHESVKTDRPAIRAVNKNLFFIDHRHREMAMSDGSSKRNEFEANYLIQLALYLVKQGYRTDQITILVMYLGQRQFIANKTKSNGLLRGLRVTVTDNYQGEESDIILLSLVRSNSLNRIGFLKIHNRICVALSRARCGLFIIGDMTLLSEVSDQWRNIRKTLTDHESIGPGLSLSCKQHSKEEFLADKPESFAKRPEGGCNKPCIARLDCGHQCELMCHNYDTEHKEVICHKKCPAILSCGHPCSKRCHVTKPDQHNSCRVLVDKVIDACRHTVKFECSQTPKLNDCKTPLLKMLSCDHMNNVPCGIASIPSEFRRFSCLSPCDTTLACEHKCVGTCGKCQSGHLHIPCQARCDRLLICGHTCRSNCAIACPPCQQNCQTRCGHSQCKKKCGELCVPCKEPCDYKCKHLICTRLCSEPCNRGPCNEPCENTLKCGHPCIGICGEPCPPKCRVCHPQVVNEIFFGNEDEPDARFVHLPDCKHLIEVTGLDKFVFGTPDQSKEYGAIRFPECPKCKQPIRCCKRYMPMINQINNYIETIKKKILGYQSSDEIKAKQKALQRKYDETMNKLVEIYQKPLQNRCSNMFEPGTFLSNGSLVLLENIFLFYIAIEKIMADAKKKLAGLIFNERVYEPLNLILRYLLAQPQHINFADQQIQDIEAELSRIQCVVCFEDLEQSMKQLEPTRVLKSDERGAIDQMQYLIKKKGQFTDNDRQKFDGFLKKLKQFINLPGLGITEKERINIVKALGMGRGHWYVCPNNHPYLITECGGANQVSKCPECGESIGGANHALLPTNRHFGLMDGSQHPAWSNEANLNMQP